MVNDDNDNIISWETISWPDYNTANGETRPASGFINGNEIILMGLGKKTIKERGKPSSGKP